MLRSTRSLRYLTARPIARSGPLLSPISRSGATATTKPAPGTVQTSFFATKQQPPSPPPPKFDKIDTKAEKEIAKRKLEARPEEVSVESSRRQVFEPSATASGTAEDQNPDVAESLKQELGTVKSTFALTTVPREPYVLGLAGTLPYLGTSLGTVYLSWDLNQTWPLSNALLNTLYINPESAQYWLQVLESVQLGYGAVIISFLGAIHWGMEWADSTSKPPSASRAKFRYAVGVLAPVVAWPTLLMPVNAALIAQFAAFTGLYFIDTRAASRGWAPSWYGTYRFVLTFVVGTAIVASLVGRAKIGEGERPLTSDALRERLNPAPRDERNDVDWVKLEKEDKQKAKEEEKKEEEERKAKKKEGKRGKDEKNDSKDKNGSE